MHASLLVITLLLSQHGLSVSDNTGDLEADIGTFENPAARARPRFRYWLPDASVDPGIVQQNIKDAGALGAGGVEFLPYYNYGTAMPELDWSTYGFGTPAYINVFKAALEAHKDAGLAMDFPLGPNQGQGVPAQYGDEGLQWDLSPYSVAVPSSGTFSGTLPGWGTGDLVAVVSAQVLSSRNITTSSNSGSLFDSQPNYIQYVLNSSSLEEWTQNASSDGQTHLQFPTDTRHGYRIFTFYQYHTHHQNLPVNSNVSETIFDNGSYIVDHFSARGAQTVTRFWDEYLLSEEVKSLLLEVGNYGWEDSIEIESNISWTPSLPDVFLKKYGYSLEPYLPLIMFGNNNIGIHSGAPGAIQCLLDTSDQGDGYVNDFRGALVEGYRAYLSHYEEWTNNMSLQYSSQVSYNLPMDMLASIPSVGAPECESLGFGNSIDGYRQFSGPAVLSDKKVISNEMGAVESEAYQHPITDLLWQIGRATSGGVNQVVLHGQSFTGDYYETTWPGYTAFWYIFSNLVSGKQPSWDHGFSEALNYITRLQHSQRKGNPKIDVAIYNKNSATDPKFPTIYNKTDLINEGFTYVYLSPDNFALPQAHVKNGSLAPDGPEFRAMIIQSSSNMTLGGVREIKKYARAGLPVILSGGLPYAYFTGAGETALLRTEISSLKDTENIYTVPGAKPPASCLSTGNVSVATTKQPYFLNPWTGEQTPVLQYQQEGGRTIIPLSFAGNQTVIIAFIGLRGRDTPVHVTTPPPSVFGYNYNGSTGDLHVHISTQTNDEPLLLSDGKAIQLSTRNPGPNFQLTNWTLTVEHWERPSNLSDASVIAVKRNTTHQISALISWQEIPTIVNASGIGYYATSLSWPPSSSSNNSTATGGAYILLPKTSNGARLYINGQRVPAFDFQAPKIIITPYLHVGTNDILIEAPSLMWNYLRSMIDDLKTGGVNAGSELESAMGSIPDPVDNGLIGEVWVIPYADVRV
ncbi:hypothetical protein BO71DRAFT_447541 [Aspergillus ellipticus CBS 707.79]|uniref:Secreted protein n=1 Tax=Aspergillus ellipticus CBS 707.79 TaxID=1448320 RepID=A0A319DKA5_9EURO|nr:hypothetical protein BO71DRAFT_447541 [Aspergillus ellipticus CBS 707.79]